MFGLRNRLLRIHMLICAELGRRQYLGIQCVCYNITSIHINMGTFISEFCHMRKARIYLSAIRVHNIRNLVYLYSEFLVFITALFQNIYLSERFKFHDSIIDLKFTAISKIFSLWMFSLFSLWHFCHNWPMLFNLTVTAQEYFLWAKWIVVMLMQVQNIITTSLQRIKSTLNSKRIFLMTDNIVVCSSNSEKFKTVVHTNEWTKFLLV
jgi:hypothetical protein